jgi:uncharacterized membrane protein
MRLFFELLFVAIAVLCDGFAFLRKNRRARVLGWALVLAGSFVYGWLLAGFWP